MRLRRILWIVVAALLLFYIASYCLMSARGAYGIWPTGKLRYVINGQPMMTVGDRAVWFPSSQACGDLWDLYCPLWQLDRWLIHKDRILIPPRS